MFEWIIISIYKLFRSVANRLFTANKDLQGVSNIEWNMTVIKSDVINAVCFPVNKLAIFSYRIQIA